MKQRDSYDVEMGAWYRNGWKWVTFHGGEWRSYEIRVYGMRGWNEHYSGHYNTSNLVCDWPYRSFTNPHFHTNCNLSNSRAQLVIIVVNCGCCNAHDKLKRLLLAFCMCVQKCWDLLYPARILLVLFSLCFIIYQNAQLFRGQKNRFEY